VADGILLLDGSDCPVIFRKQLSSQDASEAMAEIRVFKGFFSYAHHDAKTDAGLIPALKEDVEDRVNAKLANARLTIWRDKDELRTGDRWDPRIEAELRNADVLIVLLTPRWIESDYCRKEYVVFEEVEASRSVGEEEYIAPILARAIEQQEKHLTPQQHDVPSRIKQRQYFQAVATDFLRLPKARRNVVIDKIADDIAGMIERLRIIPTAPAPVLAGRRHRNPSHLTEFSDQAESYAEVGFLRPTSEVRVDIASDNSERGLYAQVGFVERLFVKTGKAYVEFGVSRAYLSVTGAAPGQLYPSEQFRGEVGRAAVVELHEAPEALSIAMYAEAGRGLGALALPPTDGNYWSRIGTATREVQPARLRAELRVSFSAQGLRIFNDNSPPPSPATTRKIKAILGVAIGKQERIGQNGQICRELPVRERTQ
jgi:hypothetical protein